MEGRLFCWRFCWFFVYSVQNRAWRFAGASTHQIVAAPPEPGSPEFDLGTQDALPSSVAAHLAASLTPSPCASLQRHREMPRAQIRRDPGVAPSLVQSATVPSIRRGIQLQNSGDPAPGSPPGRSSRSATRRRASLPRFAASVAPPPCSSRAFPASPGTILPVDVVSPNTVQQLP